MQGLILFMHGVGKYNCNSSTHKYRPEPVAFISMNFLFFVFALFTWANAHTIIGHNKYDSGLINLHIGNIQIMPGYYWSIWKTQYAGLHGRIRVEENAGLYVSSKSGFAGLRVDIFGILGSIENKGIISFKSVQSITAFVYDIVTQKFFNTGQVFLGGDGSSIAPRTYITTADFQNYGMLSFYSRTKKQGNAYLGVAGLPIDNYGSICLYNFEYNQFGKVRGDGCLVAKSDGMIHLRNPLLKIDERQTLVLDAPTAAIKVSGVKPGYPLKVAGYGNGNILASEVIITSWKYDPRSGMVYIYTDLFKWVYVQFHIGTGYDVTKFKLDTVNLGGIKIYHNALRYWGPIPSGANEPPKYCNLKCIMEPSQPDTGSSSTSSTLQTTATAVPTTSIPTSLTDATTSSTSTIVTSNTEVSSSFSTGIELSSTETTNDETTASNVSTSGEDTATNSASNTGNITGDNSATNTDDNSATNTGDNSATNTGDNTDDNTATNTGDNSATNTGDNTDNNTATNTGDNTATNTGDNTDDNTATNTGDNSATNTGDNTDDNSATNTDDNTATNTGDNSATNTGDNTDDNTATNTGDNTDDNTATNTGDNTDDNTATNTGDNTDDNTATNTGYESSATNTGGDTTSTTEYTTSTSTYIPTLSASTTEPLPTDCYTVTVTTVVTPTVYLNVSPVI
ncbi:hypothetical protein DICA1_E30306 [Diutina catenulata]